MAKKKKPYSDIDGWGDIDNWTVEIPAISAFPHENHREAREAYHKQVQDLLDKRDLQDGIIEGEYKVVEKKPQLKG